MRAVECLNTLLAAPEAYPPRSNDRTIDSYAPTEKSLPNYFDLDLNHC
jgi:hypothetical protein